MNVRFVNINGHQELKFQNNVQNAKDMIGKVNKANAFEGVEIMFGDFVFGFILVGLMLLCSIIIIAPFIYIIRRYSEKAEQQALRDSYDDD